MTEVTQIARIPENGGFLEIKALIMYDSNKPLEKIKGAEFVLIGSPSQIVRLDLEDVAELQRVCAFLYDLANKLRLKEEMRAEYASRTGISVGAVRTKERDLQAIVSFQETVRPLPFDCLLQISDGLKETLKVLNSSNDPQK
jgi:hypothetical protein